MLLDELVETFASFEPAAFPVISLYLDTSADQHGRANVDSFLRKELKERLETFPAGSSDRESFEKDAERIQKYVADDLSPSANGLVIFACYGAGLFETLEFEAPIHENRLYVYNQPHLYGLARLNDQYPRYAVVVADTNRARVCVFGLNRVLACEDIKGTKTRGTSVGGWSQARYQRHIEHYHVHHAKEIVDTLERVVREDKIGHVILAGDEKIVPLIDDQMPEQLKSKVIDVVKLDVNAPEHEVLTATLELLRKDDANTDADKVRKMFDELRSDGLAVAGPKKTLAALTIGQVDELLLSASMDRFEAADEEVEINEDQLAAIAVGASARKAAKNGNGSHTVLLPDELVTKAAQTSAKVTFVEDPALLAGVGGVGAILRYRI